MAAAASPEGTARRVLARLRGLLLAPRAALDAIAAEGDTRRWLWRRYVPALVLLLLAGSLAVNLVLPPDPRTETVQTFRPRPDGTLEPTGTAARTTAPLRLTDLSAATLPLFAAALVAFALLAFAVVAIQALFARWLILRAAPLYGAPADRPAATKLTVYAQTGPVLAAILSPLPWIGDVAWLAGLGHLVAVTYLGAPRLLPPLPEERRRFARVAVYRSLVLGVLLLLAVVATFLVLVSLTPIPAALPPGGRA